MDNEKETEIQVECDGVNMACLFMDGRAAARISSFMPEIKRYEDIPAFVDAVIDDLQAPWINPETCGAEYSYAEVEADVWFPGMDGQTIGGIRSKLTRSLQEEFLASFVDGIPWPDSFSKEVIDGAEAEIADVLRRCACDNPIYFNAVENSGEHAGRAALCQ